MSQSTSDKTNKSYAFEPLHFEHLPLEEAQRRSQMFLDSMKRRRSIRAFASDPVPLELISNAIATAGTAPSGANQQPWKFVVVSDPELKRQIREGAEKEERENYERRFPEEWLDALAPLGTDWHKEFLEIAPYIIVVFKEDYGYRPIPSGSQADGAADVADSPRNVGVRIKHYYAAESIGIASGFLIASLHQAGLAVLTHTPSPMSFLREILQRPENEKPFLVLPVGYPAEDCQVPVIQKKSLDEIMIIK